MTLPDPHHSWPRKSNALSYGFHLWYQGRRNFHTFAQPYAAKHFINLILDGDTFTWENTYTIISERGVKIQAEGYFDLERTIEYEFTSEERSFVFSEPERSVYTRFPRDGKQGPAYKHDDDYDDAAGTTTLPNPNADIPTPPKRIRAPRTPSTRTTPVPRPAPTGDTFSAADVAQSLNTDAKAIRTALRKAAVAKPDSGRWEWPLAELDAITALIKANLK